jgi:hypothetical protein
MTLLFAMGCLTHETTRTTTARLNKKQNKQGCRHVFNNKWLFQSFLFSTNSFSLTLSLSLSSLSHLTIIGQLGLGSTGSYKKLNKNNRNSFGAGALSKALSGYRQQKRSFGWFVFKLTTETDMADKQKQQKQ